MISLSRTPTRLVDPKTRPKVRIEPVVKPSRLRSLSVATALAGLLVRLAVLWGRRQAAPGHVGAELRRTFEALGGLWIKTGQLLSLRIDFLPRDLCEELAKLQHRSVGFPTDVSRAIIEEDLGAPVETYFAEFDSHPFAVASIGQVFRARLRQENRWVAVKVQRPYMDETFRRDFAVVRVAVWLLAAIRYRRHMRWDLGLKELSEVMQEEIDYHYEASNIRRMRRSLKPHKIFVPKLYGRYCSKRVLVTEFVHGVLMADYIRVQRTDPLRLAGWLKENDIEPARVARRLLYSIFRQLLEDNLYHGDLHPGNIVLLRRNGIALIDYGTASFTEREYLERFRIFVRALGHGDYSKAADICFMLTARLPAIDLESVKEKMIQVLRTWTQRTLVRELPYHSKSLENVTVALMRLLVSHRCVMEWAWLRIHRAFTTLDVSLATLYPKANYSKLLQTYFQQAERRALEQMFTPQMTLRSMAAYRTSLDIQDRLNEYSMFQGQLVRRHAQMFEATTDKFASFLAYAVATAAICAIAVEAAAVGMFVDQHYPASAAGWLGSDLLGFLARGPRLDYWVWPPALLFGAYLCMRVVRAARILRRRDARQSRVAAF